MRKLTFSLAVGLFAITLFSCGNNPSTEKSTVEDTAVAAKNETCTDCNDIACQDYHADAHRIDSVTLHNMALKDAAGVRFAPKIYTAAEIQAMVANVDCNLKVLVCSDASPTKVSNENIALRIDDKMEDLVEVFYTIHLFKALLRMDVAKFHFYNAYDQAKNRPDIVFEVLNANNTVIYFGDLSGTYPPVGQ